jgi:hypothetical protein
MGYFTKKGIIITLLLAFFGMNRVNSQEKKIGVKFNTGMSFSKPAGDLGEVADKGKAMQLFAGVETSYHQNFSKNTKFGIKGAVVLGQDWANFLASDRSTELKISVPSITARIYPISFSGSMEEGLEKILPEGLPFLVEIPVWIAVYSTFNSLHFDYGVGFGKILETAYIDEVNFQDETVKRTMRYSGWGFQPQIFQSESSEWTVNAVFDFGKYEWKNAAGGTSSFKRNHVGFGIQYNF